MSEVAELEAKTATYRRDQRLIAEATAIIRQHAGSLHLRTLRTGVNDGSKDEHFSMVMFEFPREEVDEDHRKGLHAKLERPQLDCRLCQQRLAQFRRRVEMRRDIVAELGGQCHLCREFVTNTGARFAHRRGGRSRITQMLQWDPETVLAEARENYVLLCGRCTSNGGRRRVVEKEAGFIPVGIQKRPPRWDKGKPRRRPGESLAHYRLRCGGRF